MQRACEETSSEHLELSRWWRCSLWTTTSYHILHSFQSTSQAPDRCCVFRCWALSAIVVGNYISDWILSSCDAGEALAGHEGSRPSPRNTLRSGCAPLHVVSLCGQDESDFLDVQHIATASSRVVGLLKVPGGAPQRYASRHHDAYTGCILASKGDGRGHYYGAYSPKTC